MSTFRSLASLCSWRRQVGVFLAVGLVSALFAFHHPQPVAATPSRYAADPLGLIADYDKMSFYSTHPDSYEVFICDPDRVDVTLDDAVAFLNSSGVGDFWSSISNGQHSVVFVAGTTFEGGGSSIRCQERISHEAASGQYRAGFIFVPERLWQAAKTPGWHFVRNDPENRSFYPDNARWIISALSQRLLD